MKKVIYTVLASVSIFASCNQSNELDMPKAKSAYIVALPGAKTKAVDDPNSGGAITPVYTDVTSFFVTGTGVASTVWTSQNITDKYVKFEQMVTPDSVIVLVNSALNLSEIINIPQLNDSLIKLTVESQNDGINNVTLLGKSKSFTTGTAWDEHTTVKEVNVALGALVSRFELGTVKAAKPEQITSIKVDAVYINNWYTDFGKTNLRCYTDESWPAVYPSWAMDEGNSTVTSENGTKCYAFHVFASNDVPHIVYKISGTLAEGVQLRDGTINSFTNKYVTIRGFKANNADLKKIDPNMIYKMGLLNGGIAIEIDNITPNPEETAIDLKVNITVTDWNTQDLTPNI